MSSKKAMTLAAVVIDGTAVAGIGVPTSEATRESRYGKYHGEGNNKTAIQKSMALRTLSNALFFP
jgi:hypothetical protein